MRFNVQHSEVQDLPKPLKSRGDPHPEFGSLFGLARLPIGHFTIRVFPALPAAWPDLVVHDFRTQGAFLLSAVRERGRRGGCAW